MGETMERAEEEGSPSAAGVAGTTALYAGDLIVATAGRPRSRSGHVAILCDDCERQEMELVCLGKKHRKYDS